MMWGTSRDEFVTSVINLAGKCSIFSRASLKSNKLKFHLRNSLNNIKIEIFAQTDFPKT